MRLTYEQHKILAGMTVEGKLQIRNKKGIILKPTPSKTWRIEASQYIQGPQPQSPALMETRSPTSQQTSFLGRQRRPGKVK